jgi:predicted ATPase/DNA-binding SARP family transcriptional activator
MGAGLLSISLLGPLQVALDGAPLGGFKYNKARALLAYLALNGATPQPRAELAALFWPELPERGARRNLTQVVIALRDALGEATAGSPRLLATSEAVQLSPEVALDVDAARFGALLDQAERHAHRSWRTCSACAGRLDEAMALYRGDFLSQRFVADSAAFEEWVLLWRERLRQRAFSALERLTQRAEWCGAFGEAVTHTRRLVALDPLREASQRELMRLLALDGQGAAAAAQYQQLQRRLARELGVAPEPDTQRLQADIRAGRLDAARMRRYAAPPVNAPQPPNALIGREADVRAVCQQLGAAAVRALTITGAPGIGKTRLALAAAHAVRFDFEDGVHVVDLAPAAEAALVIPAMAQALGVKERPGQPLTAALAARLKTQHTLLVLDNFEHVLEAAGSVAELLATCPGVKLLITSRAPLRIRAEQQYSLGPLPAAAAIELFAARAGQREHAFTPEELQAVGAVCAQVDHLPLAIELIAVRAKDLALNELGLALTASLDTLSDGAHDLPSRHRTLREAIRWSFERLSADEQRVFAHLGVLMGGGTASTVQALLAPGPPAAAALEAVAEASLAQTPSTAGQTRFTLLETLRAYALEQLAERGELVEAQARHAAHFLELAERARPELEGPEQRTWRDRLEHELPNLRAAMGWGLSHNLEAGLRLALALRPFWMVRGYLSEGRSWLQRLRAAAEGTPAHAALEAEALVEESRLAISQGSLREAVDLALLGRERFMRLENTGGLGRALHALGHAQIDLADYEPARGHLEESLALFQSEGDRPGMAAALNSLGYVATRRGDYPAAKAYAEQAAALYRELNQPRLVAGISVNVGMTALAQGDYATAQRLMEAALPILRELRDSDALPIALLNLGNVYQDTGDLERARGCYEEAIALGRPLGTTTIAAPLLGLGSVLLARGDLTGARGCFVEALQARMQSGERRGVALALGSFARLEQAQQRPDRAARLLGAAEALRKAIGAPIQPRAQKNYDQLIDALRTALGEASFSEAWMAGGALTIEQAVALAAGQIKAGDSGQPG